MKASEIVVGGIYVAKISNVMVKVKVLKINTRPSTGRKSWTVRNLRTNRTTTFYSPLRFRTVARDFVKEDLKSDPTNAPTAGQTSEMDATVTKQSSVAANTSQGTKISLANELREHIRPESTIEHNYSSHLIVWARAGTGKTTTLVEGLRVLKGGVPGITPSPQQTEIWNALCKGKKPQTVCFVAFNKSIASELQRRVPIGCVAMTLHSMGYKVVNQTYGYQKPNRFATEDIIAEILQEDVREIKKTKRDMLRGLVQLTGLCKMNLVDPANQEAVLKLAAHYDVELNGSRDRVLDLLPQILERARDPKGSITFDDMIWLPVVNNLQVQKYDLLLVDEAQDLNRCQQSLVKKAGRRLVVCGDPKQAIYGFAGADSESMSRMEKELSSCDCGAIEEDRETHEDWCNKTIGCKKLMLTVTRRCAHLIVEEAKRIVPDFEAHESNKEGSILNLSYPLDKQGRPRNIKPEMLYTIIVEEGDMVLCRCNAPLVSQCFSFLKMGRKAVILGRKIGESLIATIDKSKTYTVPLLIGWLSDWLANETAKENAKRQPDENRLIALQDKYDCIIAFTEGMNTVEQVKAKINAVFADRMCPSCKKGFDENVETCFDCQKHLISPEGIKLSSIHKAKGLEAKRVFFLEPDGASCPHPMAKSAWQREQEMNLRYVAITRAIEELVYVS